MSNTPHHSPDFRWEPIDRAKPGGRIELPAYGDQRVILTDAEALPIPALPEGYRDLPRSFTTCRNYQFGVAHFGDYAARVAA